MHWNLPVHRNYLIVVASQPIAKRNKVKTLLFTVLCISILVSPLDNLFIRRDFYLICNTCRLSVAFLFLHLIRICQFKLWLFSRHSSINVSTWSSVNPSRWTAMFRIVIDEIFGARRASSASVSGSFYWKGKLVWVFELQSSICWCKNYIMDNILPIWFHVCIKNLRFFLVGLKAVLSKYMDKCIHLCLETRGNFIRYKSWPKDDLMESTWLGTDILCPCFL